jgi:signal peptidase I
MNKNKKLVWMGVAVAAIVALVVIGVVATRQSSAPIVTAGQNAAGKNCAVTKTEDTVSGQSMDGIIANGQKITVLQNYYACNPIERGDVVVYSFSATQERIVKSVKGIPGDTFALKPSGAVWNLIINGSVAKDSTGEPYQLDARGNAMLSLYAHDYKGVIPADSYLILGNVPTGSLDSTHFGLVSDTDFIGKVQL